MSDDVALPDFLDMHAALGQAWKDWSKSRDDVGEFENCLVLMELLATETRTWLYSRLAASDDITTDLTPKPDGPFGTEVSFLQQMQSHQFFSALASSMPEINNSFVSVDSVITLFKDYDNDYNNDSFQCALDQLSPSRDTWLTTIGHFVTLRNLYSHKAKQKDRNGAPINITARFTRLAPALGKAMSQWVSWMVHLAAKAFGSYRLLSRDEVLADNHYVLRDLREKQEVSSNFASTWYILYKEKHQPVELFARLETIEQISAEVRKRADRAESALFDSADKGMLLPLTGPAFGSPDHANSPGAREVIKRVRDVLGDPRFDSQKDLLKDYLARIVSARLNFEIIHLVPESRQDGNIKARLAGDLAVLALQASMSFGSSLSVSGSPLSGGSESLAQKDIDALSECFKDVFSTIGALPRAVPAGQRIDLGADTIEELLKWLRDEVNDGRLSLTSITRLADLVWHALRWDAPLYPDAEALDVQLWLGTPRDANTRRGMYRRTPASRGAALLIDQLKLIDYFEGWSDRLNTTLCDAMDDAKRWKWQDPHDLLAKTMARCLDIRRGESSASEINGDKENVFIVDATFDDRICRALALNKTPSAVVYPIDLEDIHKKRYPGWAIRRFPSPLRPDPEDGVGQYSILWHEIGRSIQYQDIPRVIVIKPFGAPLENTGKLDEAAAVAGQIAPRLTTAPFPLDTGHYIAVRRRYLFDDVSIVNDLVRTQDSMPPGFRDALHNSYRPFELYFLGYSLEEYGRRTRMLADIRPKDWDGIPSHGSLLYFSEPPPDGLISPYLRGAGIEHYDAPLRPALQNLGSRLAREEREEREKREGRRQ